VKSPGDLKKISAAVLINDPKALPEQIDKIKQSMAAALGIDEKRGDNLTVQTIAFTDAKEKEGEADAKTWEKENNKKQLIRDLVRYGSMLLSVIVFVGGMFMAVKMTLPLLASVQVAAAQEAAPARAAAGAPAPAAPAPASRPGPTGASVQLTLSAMANEKPEVFTRALNKYMKTEAAKGSPQKEAANVN